MFVAQSPMPVSRSHLWQWHMRPGAFERLMPPWERLTIVSRQARVSDDRGGWRLEPARSVNLADGDRLEFRIHKGPLSITWKADHVVRGESDPEPGFSDIMAQGPFASWRHDHRFLAGAEEDQSLLRDEVQWKLPLGPLGATFGQPSAQAAIDRMFAFRHERTRRDLARHGNAGGSMRIVMSGSSGAIGRELCHFLTTGGHTVDRLVRRKAEAGEIFWQPGAGVRGGQIDDAAMEGCDAVVHLAGEPIAQGRWTEAKKKAIRESRVEGTRLIARTVADLKRRPSVLIVASGIHYYGDRGDQELTEEAGLGSGFLAEVSRDWEGAIAPAVEAGIRVVVLRIGLVLSPRAGLLARLLPWGHLGLLPVLGPGTQWWSWIGQDDLLGVVQHALTNPGLRGPVNAVTPQPVRQHEFASILASTLHRPLGLRVPAMFLRGALGELAEVVTTSTRAVPEALRQSGFRFQTPGLAEALAWELNGQA